MKRNVFALVVVIILGSFTFWMVMQRDRSSMKKELRDFSFEDTAHVTKIFLADKALNQVTLTKETMPGGKIKWMVDGKYVARPDAITQLLRTIHNLSVKEPVGLKARENIIKQLATGATKCAIYVGDDLVKQYYIGGATPDETGTYMLNCDVSDPDDILNSTEPFVIEVKGWEGYLSPYYFTKEAEWRDRTIFQYYAPDIRSIKVEHAGHPETSFIVSQGADGKSYNVTSLDGKKIYFDTIPVRQYISYFGKINFENFETTLKPEHKDSIMHSPWAQRITVTDASGKPNEVLMFMKKNDGFMPDDTTAAAPPPFDPDHMYGIVNNGKDFVILNYFVFGKLLIDPDYFSLAAQKAKADEEKAKMDAALGRTPKKK
ncbi:MAG: DUF4340 domain-containing protein [Bacteroidetes bacterium]|nr:DUF4340 domain-containing protein [Bacteroidota bacterium]